jgi:hypothetical protein
MYRQHSDGRHLDDDELDGAFRLHRGHDSDYHCQPEYNNDDGEHSYFNFDHHYFHVDCDCNRHGHNVDQHGNCAAAVASHQRLRQ